MQWLGVSVHLDLPDPCGAGHNDEVIWLHYKLKVSFWFLGTESVKHRL